MVEVRPEVCRNHPASAPQQPCCVLASAVSGSLDCTEEFRVLVQRVQRVRTWSERLGGRRNQAHALPFLFHAPSVPSSASLRRTNCPLHTTSCVLRIPGPVHAHMHVLACCPGLQSSPHHAAVVATRSLLGRVSPQWPFSASSVLPSRCVRSGEMQMHLRLRRLGLGETRRQVHRAVAAPAALAPRGGVCREALRGARGGALQARLRVLLRGECLSREVDQVPRPQNSGAAGMKQRGRTSAAERRPVAGSSGG